MPGTNNKPSIDDDLPLHVYSSDRKVGILRVLKSFVKEFPEAHALGFRFAERTIKSRYRQSVLGILWAFLPPVATAIIWITLYQSHIINIKDPGAPYPVFVITGTMLWSVFTNAMLMPMQTVQTNKSILVKINFPREALMVNAFYEILFNACVAFVIIIIELIVFRIPVSLNSLLFIPGVFMLILLGMSFGLLLLPLSVLYKDVSFALPSFLQFAMYLTPVVYAKPVYSGLAKIMAFNPVTPLLTSARCWLLGMSCDVVTWHIGIVLISSLLLMVIGLVLQRITIEILIERMGS